MTIELKLRQNVANFLTVKQARQRMWLAFEEDPELRETYVAMIEGFFIDKVPGMKEDHMQRLLLARGLCTALYKEEIDPLEHTEY